MYHSNNGRGATLLLVINKIFCRILLEQIKIGVDRKLPKEQTGFRSQRSTAKQIFILTNILEQVNECRTGLYSHTQRNLVEHHEELWDTREDVESDSRHEHVQLLMEGLKISPG